MRILILLALVVAAQGCDFPATQTNANQTDPAKYKAAVATADKTLSARQANYAKAVRDFLVDRHSRADYIAAEQLTADLRKKVDYLKAEDASTGAIAEASQAWISSKAVTAKMESEVKVAPLVLAADKAKKQAEADLEKATDEFNKVADGNDEARKLTKEYRVNSAIESAIQSHRLAEGMTYGQAMGSLGKPYSITTSGSTIIATWQYDDGNYWSAMFIGDSAYSISNTRL